MLGSVSLSRLARRALVLAFMAMPMSYGVAHAATPSATFTSERDTVTLISGDGALVAGRAPMLALRFALKPKWHTYWSNPGDAGAAADARLGYDGATPAPISFDWPLPRRLPDGPLMSYGYVDTVTLPIRAPAPARIGADGATITVVAEWLVCADVCVPENATLTLHLPSGAAPAANTPAAGPPAAGAPAATADRPTILAAEAAVPAAAGPDVTLAADNRLHVAQALPPGATAWFLPSAPGVIDQLAGQALAGTGNGYTLQLKPASGTVIHPPLDGVLVVRDATGAEHGSVVHALATGAPARNPAAVAAPIATPLAPVAAPPVGASAGLLRALLLAVLGGLVLNLMPCVFPVLAMKAMSVARLSGAERRHLRSGALAYTAGVLVAFAAIGGLTLLLRDAGRSVGWGFQFQSVAFVGIIAWLLWLVGLNLSGLFEVGTGAMGIGQGAASSAHARGGVLGEAATGLLAVLVATPCTAPFMGVALASALSAPAVEAMAIFFALGIGLALPYLLLALVPQVASRLPRPGGWMEVLRRALAFPVYGAVVWLVWVAAQQGGPAAVLGLGVGMVLLAFAGWLYGLGQHLRAREHRDRNGTDRNVRRARICGVLALASVLLALALLPDLARTGTARGPGSAGTETSASLSGLPTEPFSEARLAALRTAHKPVFVDMSAAWCITCLVNERVAFSSSDLRCAFTRHGITVLRGDWTRYDPAITRYLASLGRDGVPLYVWYPAEGDPRILPQVLTPGLLLDLAGGCDKRPAT